MRGSKSHWGDYIKLLCSYASLVVPQHKPELIGILLF